MNMYLHELKAYRKSTIIWTLSLITLLVLFLSLFPAFSRDAEEFMRLLDGFPEEVKKALGLSIDTLATILGYFSYLFLYIKLTGAIQAMNLGLSILSKETREKTADFLLTKPVTRTQVMTAKLLAALTSLVITNLAFLGCVTMMTSMVKIAEYSVKTLVLISITLFFIQLIFLAIGVLIAVIVPRIKSVISVSLGTVFILFIVGMISSSTDDYGLRYLTPFSYFDEYYIIKNSGYEKEFIFIGAVFIIMAMVASYVIYQKKDVHSV